VEIQNYREASKEGIAVETNYRGTTKEKQRGAIKISWRAER